MKLWFIALLASFPLWASAQTAIGRGLVDGRTVMILDDGTWDYADPAVRGCSALEPWLEFCGNISIWVPEETGADYIWQYYYSGYEFGIVFSYLGGENVGTQPADLISDFKRDLLTLGGRDVEQLIAAPIESAYVGGANREIHPFNVEMRGGYGGTIVVTPVIGARGSAILATATIDGGYTPGHRYLHESFLAQFEVVNQ